MSLWFFWTLFLDNFEKPCQGTPLGALLFERLDLAIPET
jgi:hypothetical protein